MRFIIDGYNLLFAAGVAERKSDQTNLRPGLLHAARWRLIRQIADYLDEKDCCQTTIVFDAKHAPPGLPSRYEFSGILILFARDHAEADDLIEELVQAESTPKKLKLITSDLKLQDVAKRRRATVVDSDTWMVKMESHSRTDTRSDSNRATPTPERKPDPKLSDAEVQAWLDEWQF